MKEKQEFARNRWFNLFALFGIVFARLTVWSLSGKDVELKMAFLFGIIAAVLLLSGFVFSPFCYSFDSEGVSACYLFFSNERYLWPNISSITVEVDNYDIEYRLLDFLFSQTFRIKGIPEGPKRFYMRGCICKTRRTKRLLTKYWDGTITDPFNRRIRIGWNRPKKK